MVISRLMLRNKRVSLEFEVFDGEMWSVPLAAGSCSSLFWEHRILKTMTQTPKHQLKKLFSNSTSTGRIQLPAILLAISCVILIIPTAKSGHQFTRTRNIKKLFAYRDREGGAEFLPHQNRKLQVWGFGTTSRGGFFAKLLVGGLSEVTGVRETSKFGR